ncbi:MAG: hypothetical protein FWF77_09010 [Defluviitaleaceae bacterium]|nr:hypothetical protein [Defluviitaleaceae bacterium]
MSKSTHSLEAGCSFLEHKKNESASVTRRLPSAHSPQTQIYGFFCLQKSPTCVTLATN